MRGLNRTLLSIVSELHEGAEQVAAAAHQVASSSQSLAQGASQQANSLTHTSSSAAELTAMTQRNTNHAQSVAGMMTSTASIVDDANRALREMEVSMTEITQSSAKISRIIRTIDEIAFQTNILALNAAVEAARAGEAGTGFAVVADEIRNLAQRSAQAAQDTTQLIEESIASARSGSAKVTRVAGATASLTTQANQVRSLIEEVRSGSAEQLSGIEQIARAITSMEHVTQQAAASAQESASAGEQLAGQSAALNATVSRLRALVGYSVVA